MAQADHSGLSPLVWAAVCGSVPAVELLLEANDGGISTAEGGETGGQVKQESLSGVSDRGSPTNEGEMKGEESGQEVASDINDKEQGKEEDKQESLSGTNNGDIPKEEQVIGEDNGKGALSSNNDGAVPVDEEQDCHKEGIEKAVLQPLQAAACVGSKEVCLVLINSGAKVLIISTGA